VRWQIFSGLQEPLAGVPPQVKSGCGLLVVLLQLLGWVKILLIVQVPLLLLHRQRVQLHGPASSKSRHEGEQTTADMDFLLLLLKHSRTSEWEDHNIYSCLLSTAFCIMPVQALIE
jgi:hypothetical protein